MNSKHLATYLNMFWRLQNKEYNAAKHIIYIADCRTFREIRCIKKRLLYRKSKRTKVYT
ncbi:hypothetical protein [Sporosarcina sp. E16_8]|uniref:hypothetical protein n=1 Tax=Sporosarcina sp. E16_8 TaxID=2789295 RepID=UPI001A9370F3|nr:hypothetical protein [Sporosarcina sp. E16_8]MBO0587746.1 hypothetical protein [Sporosarcina sp. E16_8]